MPVTDEPEGLRMSLDALIQKRGGSSSGRGNASHSDRGRGRGSFPSVRGGVSKPESGGRGPRDRNSSEAKPGGGRGIGGGSSRGGLTGSRGGGRFGGHATAGRVGGAGGRGYGRGPAMQQQPQLPFHPKQPQPHHQQQLHMQAPFLTPSTPAEMQMQARLAEQQRIILEQQRQTILLQQQLLQQQAMAQAAAHHAVRSLPTDPTTTTIPSMPSTRKPHPNSHSYPQPDPEPEEELRGPTWDKLDCQLDEETGNVVIMMEDIAIVTATPTGELYLSTGGWYENETVEALNIALKPLGMKIIVNGEVDMGNWSVSAGSKLLKFREEEGEMVIGAWGNNAATRAQDLLQFFTSPRAAQKGPGPRGAASAPASRPMSRPTPGAGHMGRPGAAQVQIEVDANVARRMRAQGRF